MRFLRHVPAHNADCVGKRREVVTVRPIAAEDHAVLAEDIPKRIEALAKLCIFMHVGELDSGWVAPMQQQAEEFRSKGYTVHLTVEKGESHVLSTLVGTRSARLYDQIEQSRQGCGK